MQSVVFMGRLIGPVTAAVKQQPHQPAHGEVATLRNRNIRVRLPYIVANQNGACEHTQQNHQDYISCFHNEALGSAYERNSRIGSWFPMGAAALRKRRARGTT